MKRKWTDFEIQERYLRDVHQAADDLDAEHGYDWHREVIDLCVVRWEYANTPVWIWPECIALTRHWLDLLAKSRMTWGTPLVVIRYGGLAVECMLVDGYHGENEAA